MTEDNFVYLSRTESDALQKQIESVRDASIVSLVLNAGLFLNEVEQLKTADIDWEKPCLHIQGDRQRKIPLNGETLSLLKAWSQKRVPCKTDHMFLTTKGKVAPLSKRSIDNLIRKYASKAGIEKATNTQVLRNTFAVRLFASGLNESAVADLLGVSSQQFLQRYRLAAQQVQTTLPESNRAEHDNSEQSIDQLDGRSAIQKLWAKLRPQQPKQSRLLSQLDGPIKPHPDDVFFGRVTLLRDLSAGLKKEQPQLVVGLKGSGKTHLLTHLSKQFSPSLYLDMSKPMKKLLQTLCQQLDANYTEMIPSRPAIDDYIGWAQTHPKLKQLYLFLDNIDQVTQSSLPALLLMIDHGIVLASCSTQPKKLMPITRKLKVHDLTPLTPETAQLLIEYVTQNMSINTPELLVRELMEKSNRYPGPIVDMANSLYYEHVVDRDAIQRLKHDSSTSYRDWSVMLIVFWGILIMLRFVALGTHSVEGYVLAGFGTSILVMAKFFVRKMN